MQRTTAAQWARVAALGVTAAAIVGPAAAQPEPGFDPLPLDEPGYVFDTAEQHRIRVDVVVRGLAGPFSFAFLPNGDALVAERGGSLRMLRGATGDAARLEESPVGGAPSGSTTRGGGLHEVVLHPDFASNGLVYFTYNDPVPPAADAGPDAAPRLAVTLARGRLAGLRLSNVEVLMRGEPREGGSGSRLAFAPDGSLYMTTGAPFDAKAQDPGSVYGKVLRLNADGSVPDDNPFVGRRGARPEVYTLGHRDQLGLTVHPSGAVFAAEHGPNGGDEVNRILPGRNYGWPDFSYGRSYEGPRISALPVVEGIEQPTVLWVPSIAPTGMTFYTADRIPAWTGNLFVGSARRGEIPGTGGIERVVLNENFEELRRESLLGPLRQRIRDVRQGPDGLLYAVTDGAGAALLRLSPTE